MASTNPFTERGRITEPARFTGRWGELSLIFERLASGRPVLISGVAGVGKSSLLTHIVQSAAVNLELPSLRAYYLDIAGAESAADVYRTVSGALGARGDTIAALELALVAARGPLLLALDNVHGALAAGWGDLMLEALARAARGGNLFVVAAMAGAPPVLSEPFALVRLGALAQPEVRLLTAAYLDGTDVDFSPADIREIAELSAAHPAYVQRAAFHLFESKLDPGADWRAAYRVEVQSRPIPGAPLPPAVFEGAAGASIDRSSYGEVAEGRRVASPTQRPLPDAGPTIALLVPLLAGVLLYALTGSLAVLLVAALVGAAAAGLWWRNRHG
jgi:hypothetical protein